MEELQVYRKGAAELSMVGKAFAEYAQAGDSVVAGAIGALGYYSNLRIYDRIGLVNREVAEWVRNGPRNGPLPFPEHGVTLPLLDEKGQVRADFFLDEQPTYLLFGVITGPGIRSQVLARAQEWRRLGSLWQQYVPDFVPLDGREVSKTNRLLAVFRTIDDPRGAGIEETTTDKRAEAAWSEFYRRAEKLPDEQAANR
jgi:hypothetical protein